jgi:hypothetical protein
MRTMAIPAVIAAILVGFIFFLHRAATEPLDLDWPAVSQAEAASTEHSLAGKTAPAVMPELTIPEEIYEPANPLFDLRVKSMEGLPNANALVSIDALSSDLHGDSEQPDAHDIQTLAKMRLGIDPEEVLDVNMNRKREELRKDMRSNSNAELEGQMVDQGVDPHVARNVSSIRKAMAEKAKNSAPGIYSYNIAVEIGE